MQEWKQLYLVFGEAQTKVLAAAFITFVEHTKDLEIRQMTQMLQEGLLSDDSASESAGRAGSQDSLLN